MSINLYGGITLSGYGTIKINLASIIEEKDISKNDLQRKAEMERTQLNKYCNNEITRLDTYVLSRLCTALECEIGELLEFIPPSKADGV